MKSVRFRYRKLTVICAVLTMMLGQVVTTSVATCSPASAPALADADLGPEIRTLDAFFPDLAKFDRRGTELGKKASLTRAEFDLHERASSDLKRRLSGIQNAWGAVIRKLKAAGQWDNVDQIVLAKISDSEFQGFVRREGFKKTLEEAASGLSNDANEIVSPVDALRNKVQAQDSTFERGNSTLASRVVRVRYATAPAMFAQNARCRLAHLRQGITGAFSREGTSSNRSDLAKDCYCNERQAACDAM